eukprot:TRINITY_DN3771_c0_g1_i1.p1 TRINITY_DN3771_c0_g1~~TRINITY_DN3771_c0_g1_i1.p1  ORF type:complete len:553 (-),score=82.86 TRINITY_DN3771_c0_g1_i1:648-2087(-)
MRDELDTFLNSSEGDDKAPKKSSADFVDWLWDLLAEVAKQQPTQAAVKKEDTEQRKDNTREDKKEQKRDREKDRESKKHKSRRERGEKRDREGRSHHDPRDGPPSLLGRAIRDMGSEQRGNRRDRDRSRRQSVPVPPPAPMGADQQNDTAAFAVPVQSELPIPQQQPLVATPTTIQIMDQSQPTLSRSQFEQVKSQAVATRQIVPMQFANRPVNLRPQPGPQHDTAAYAWGGATAPGQTIVAAAAAATPTSFTVTLNGIKDEDMPQLPDLDAELAADAVEEDEWEDPASGSAMAAMGGGMWNPWSMGMGMMPFFSPQMMQQMFANAASGFMMGGRGRRRAARGRGGRGRGRSEGRGSFGAAGDTPETARFTTLDLEQKLDTALPDDCPNPKKRRGGGGNKIWVRPQYAREATKQQLRSIPITTTTTTTTSVPSAPEQPAQPSFPQDLAQLDAEIDQVEQSLAAPEKEEPAAADVKQEAQ